MRVVIIGAGPSGLITGFHLLEEKNKPVVLEKQSEITSTACAEGCDLHSLKLISFDSSPYISKEVKGIKIFFPNGHHLFFNRKGVILDRNRWLKGIADEFTKSGGVLRTGANVKSIGKNSVLLASGEQIKYDVLIGADGPLSIVRKQMGIRQELVSGIQYKIKCDTSDMDYLEFYFDKRFSPQYSWVFPKEKSINVGLIAGKFRQLDSFLNFLDLKKSDILKKEGGVIPVSGVPQKIVEGNKALIGDAASMTNPLSGGGLSPLIIASLMLSKNIHDLKQYETEIKTHPTSHPCLVKARKTLLNVTNSELDKLGKLFDNKAVEDIGFLDFMRVIRYPWLIPKFTSVAKGIELTLKWGW